MIVNAGSEIANGNWLTAIPSMVNESEQILEPLESTARVADSLVASPLRRVEGDRVTELARYIFLGPRGGGDPIRIGIFAGIHGDEPAGTLAAVKFGELLHRNPEVGRGYQIFIYPICNPTGFEDRTRYSRSGKDLNREFWHKSEEPEVVLLEREIRSQAFHGLISLHADDTSNGLYGFVRGAVLTRNLLEPALREAERFLPRNTNPIIDGFPASNGIIAECYDGILRSPPELDPAPFEIILETPLFAPVNAQVNSLVAGMKAVLIEYQKFLSFAANL